PDVVGGSEGALPEDPQNVPGILSRKPRACEAERQSQANRQNRLREVLEPRERHPAPLAACISKPCGVAHEPPILRPSSCSETSPRRNSATTRPSNMTRIRSAKLKTSSSSDDTSKTPAPPSRAWMIF